MSSGSKLPTLGSSLRVSKSRSQRQAKVWPPAPQRVEELPPDELKMARDYLAVQKKVTLELAAASAAFLSAAAVLWSPVGTNSQHLLVNALSQNQGLQGAIAQGLGLVDLMVAGLGAMTAIALLPRIGDRYLALRTLDKFEAERGEVK